MSCSGNARRCVLVFLSVLAGASTLAGSPRGGTPPPGGALLTAAADSYGPPIVTTVDDPANSVGQYTSMAKGADGLPVISYQDYTAFSLKVAHCGNAACTSGNTINTVDDQPTNKVGSCTSIAIGVDGFPVISYRDDTATTVKVAHCGDAACSPAKATLTAVSESGHIAFPFTSIALGTTDGRPVVSYLDLSDGRLKLVHCGNAGCTSGNTVANVDDPAEGAGPFSAMTIGSDGLPVISYRAAAYRLKVVHCGNAACTSGNTATTVDASLDHEVGDFISIAIGADGFPVISYRDATARALKVADCGNADCSAHTVTTIDSDPSNEIGFGTSIAVAGDGLPVIAYYDETAGNLKIAYCGNAACYPANANSITTVADPDGHLVGAYPSIATGPEGLPVISYLDFTARALKVAKVTSNVAQPTVTLYGLEVTQTVQNLINSVILIEGKTTLVRAHVYNPAGTSVPNVKGLLRIRRLDSVAPEETKELTLKVDGRVRSLNMPIASSFDFDITDEARGTIEVEFQLPTRTLTCAEPDPGGVSSDCRVRATFYSSPVPKLTLVPIRYSYGGTDYVPSSDDLSRAEQYLVSTMPVQGVSTTRSPVWDWPLSERPGASNEGMGEGRDKLASKRLLEGSDNFYVGVLAGRGETANGIGKDRVALAFTYDAVTVPHEFGHSVGRAHTNCLGTEGNPGPYPWPEGKISRVFTGDAAAWGIKVLPSPFNYSPGAGDLMSYCIPRWTSDFTYCKIRESLCTMLGEACAPGSCSAYADSALSSPAHDGASQDVVDTGGWTVLVSGRVEPDGTAATLEEVQYPAWPAITSVVLPAGGSYSIRLETASGDLTYPLEPTPEPDGHQSSFVVALPGPASYGLQNVVLLKGTTVLASRAVSGRPTLAGGSYDVGTTSVTLDWSFSDPDGDPLTYSVHYSADNGATFTTLAQNLSGTTYSIEWARVRGASAASVLIVANDGANSSSASTSAFSVPGHAPTVEILSANGPCHSGNEDVVLTGTGYDLEDGALSGLALTWSSDRDGVLGTGARLDVVASVLSEGLHTITLTARDSDGQTAAATRSVTISRLPVEPPPALFVAPEQLAFVAAKGGSATAPMSLSIVNQGGGSLPWTLSATAPWIKLSEAAGSGPTSVSMTADPAGLDEGSYSGVVTVAASGATGSPVTVGVTLRVAGILSVLDAQQNEDDGDLSFTVVLSGAPDHAVTAHFRTIDGTAVAGSDYVARVGTLTFLPGETTGVVTVPVLADRTSEPDETFTLQLYEVEGAAVERLEGLGTILNDDPAGGGLGLVTLKPCRLVDTRRAVDPYGGPALVAGAPRVFSLVGQCGIPATAQAVSVNVTVTGPAAQGNVVLYRADEAMPDTPVLYYATGQTKANNAVVSLSAGGELAAFVAQRAGTTVHLIIDVNGYFDTVP